MSANIYSANRKRRLGGKIAKISGEEFENILIPWANKLNATLTRIPNGCRTIKRGNKLMVIRVKSPFDFLLSYQGKAVCFDAKSVNSNTFSHSMINQNQLNELLRIEKQLISAGLLIYLRKAQKVIFVRASKLSTLRRGASVGISDGLDLNNLKSLNLALLFS